MAAAPVTIQQAYYGAVNGTSHGYLASSLPLSEQLQNFLPGFTDRPGNDSIPPGITSYLSAATTSGHYLISRTWPDLAAARPGMVFTHVLLLPLAAVPTLHDLSAVLALLLPAPPTSTDHGSLLPISFRPAERSNTHLIPVPASWQQVGQQLLAGTLSVAISGESAHFEALLKRLWQWLPPSLRPLLTWSTRFNPPPLGVNNGLLVYAPPVVESRWAGRPLITLADTPLAAPMLPQEQLLWDAPGATSFRLFLDTLEVEPVQFRSLTQNERAFTKYERLPHLTPNELMLLAREVAALQPAPTKGVAIKTAVLRRVAETIATTTEPSLRMLRKFSLAPFADALILEAAVTTRVNALLTTATTPEEEITETFDFSTGPDANENQLWLRTSVDTALVSLLHHPVPALARALWVGLQYSAATRRKLLAKLTPTAEAARLLAATVPPVLDQAAAEPLLAVGRERAWWELHAAVAAAALPPVEALQRQIEAENAYHIRSSPHVAKLARTVADKDLLALALETGHDQLVELAGTACAKNPLLLAALDLTRPTWRRVWEHAVSQSGQLTAGLTAPAAAIDAYLSLLVDAPADSFPLLSRIAQSAFANVLHHPQRNALWMALPLDRRPAFLQATADALIPVLVSGQLPQPIENALRQEVQKPAFTTRLLYAYRAAPAAVLAVQVACDNLTDRYLADYVANLSTIQPATAVMLGRLINSKKWSQSAQKLFDKAKYLPAFRPALAECENQFSGLKKIFNANLFMGGSDYATSSPTHHSQSSPTAMPTDILVMTALGLEFNAFKELLTETRVVKHHETGTRYTQGIFAHNGKQFLIALAESGAGNIDAAQATERALSFFKPSYAFFVGVGGGIKDVDLGDVVASSELVHYEGGKAGKTYKPRIKTLPGAHELTELAKVIANGKLWQHRLGPDKTFKAEVKPIAAGEKVVASNRSATFKLINQSASQAIAVEMEGYGFLSPVHSHHVKGIVIRGISDLLEKKEESDQAGWQPIAAANAAAFAAEMLSHLLDDQADVLVVINTAPASAQTTATTLTPAPSLATDELVGLLHSSSERGKLAGILADLYDRGPEERQVWKRAGGKLGFLKQADASDAQWHHALENLAKGGGNTITLRSLLETVRTDFPTSAAMQLYYNIL